MLNKRLVWLGVITTGISVLLFSQIVASPGNMTSSQIHSSGLPYSPAMIASNGKVVVVGDFGGSLLFWQWPQPPGPVIKAHENRGGAVVVVGTYFATSGGWDPTVKRWDSITQQPRFAVQLFNARVTALCAQGDELLVAGANHSDNPVDAGAIKKDSVSLQPGQLFRLDGAFKATPVPIGNTGQIENLACGTDWILAVDSDTPNRLRWVHGDQISTIQLAQGPATALISRGEDALVADAAGIWILDPQHGTRKAFATFKPDVFPVLFLVTVNDSVFSGMSEGVFRWPDGSRFSRQTRQPVAMTAHGDSLLVLWEGGLLEQLDYQTGKVIRTAKVPQEP